MGSFNDAISKADIFVEKDLDFYDYMEPVSALS